MKKNPPPHTPVFPLFDGQIENLAKVSAIPANIAWTSVRKCPRENIAILTVVSLDFSPHCHWALFVRYSFFGAAAAYGAMRSEGKLPIISPGVSEADRRTDDYCLFPAHKKRELFLCGDPSAQRSSLPRGRFFFSKLEEEEEGDDRDSLSVLLLLVFQTIFRKFCGKLKWPAMIFVQQDPSLSDLWRKKDLDLFSLSEADPPPLLFFVKCISFKALSFPRPTKQWTEKREIELLHARPPNGGLWRHACT